MKVTITRAVAGLLLGGTITVGARAYYASQEDDDPSVLSSRITRGSLVDDVSATGTLQAVTTVQVGTQVSGIISWLGADFNSVVRKGQVIAKLDPSLLESQVEQSRASLAKATAEAENARAQDAAARQKLERIEALHVKGIVAQADLDSAALALSLAHAQVSSADAQVVQARAALAQTNVALGATVIAAPIDGIVIQRSVDVGQTVSASASSPTVFAIAADLTAMQVNAKIDESDIGRIRPSQAVRFQVDAYPGRSFAGTVLQVRLEPTLLQNVTTYSVIINASNPDLALKPGMTASVNIEIAKRDDVLRIPNAALRFRPTPAMYALLGQTPPAEGPHAAGAPVRLDAVEGSFGNDVARAALRSGAVDVVSRTAPNAGATTIDALFSPLAPVESDGRVWLLANNQLKSVRLRLGITDGQTTELVDGGLAAGTELVTNITAPGTEVRAPAAAPAGGLFSVAGGGRPGGGQGR